MLQTMTPAAQLVSMPAEAASPPTPTPYPTDVSTAITGMDASPPSTLGRAPPSPHDDGQRRAVEDFAAPQETVQSGDPDVVKPLERQPERPQRLGSFLGNGQIRGSRTDQRHGSNGSGVTGLTSTNAVRASEGSASAGSPW